MACLLVAAVCSTTCLSFTVPRQRTRSLVRLHDSTLFEEPTVNGSSEESVSGNCEMLSVVDDDYDETSSPPVKNQAFKNAAESPAPPLNFEKYLTMQKKRVSVTIRYSAESGLKPYYLTVAKRVKDQYPDVLIERVEIAGEEIEKKADGEAEAMGTFEVVVDGKLVVRTNNQRVGNNGSIFVSMAEMDLAITRARKRRRPTTVYGEDGKFIRKIDAGDIQDETVKSRLEVLKQKAMELQSQSGDGNE
jgi:hypothetical protein